MIVPCCGEAAAVVARINDHGEMLAMTKRLAGDGMMWFF